MLSSLLLDLYELTMAESYIREGMEGPATFSLFVRQLPPGRGYLAAAGLEDALSYLENLRFSSEDLAYLAGTGLFSGGLLERLAGLRFSGSVRALPEGTVCFADEPLIEVTAPILEAQLVETMLLNEIQLQTMIATKAARCVIAAGSRRLVDFSLRRTHGADAGLKVARASYVGGFDATSNVLAGQRYGIPIAGTMAHSYVEAFPSELEAFRAYARAYPDRAVLLIDTYDSIEGARNAAIVGRELSASGHQLAGVRIDSGDLATLSRQARRILDQAGLEAATVFVSGALDEFTIQELVLQGAPIAGFGVGTRLGVSADAPWLDVAYKLVSYDSRPTLKLSEGKATWPGAKQVWRERTADGPVDWLGLAVEPSPTAAAEPLLVEVMQAGQRVGPPESLEAARERCRAQLATLPATASDLRAPRAPEARPTERLLELRRELEARSRRVQEVHP